MKEYVTGRPKWPTGRSRKRLFFDASVFPCATGQNHRVRPPPPPPTRAPPPPQPWFTALVTKMPFFDLCIELSSYRKQSVKLNKSYVSERNIVNTVEHRLTTTSLRRPPRYNDHIFCFRKMFCIAANLAKTTTSLTTTLSSVPFGGR